MLRLSFPILALLIAGLSVDISAQGSSGTSGSSGSRSSGSTSASGSSGSGSSLGGSGTSGSASGSTGTSGSTGSGSAGTSGSTGSGSTGTSGSSGSGSSGSTGTSGSTGSGSSNSTGSSASTGTSGSTGSGSTGTSGTGSSSSTGSSGSTGTSSSSNSSSSSSGGGGGAGGNGNPSLLTVTEKCFDLSGIGFSSITEVSFGNTLLTTMGKFGEGSFTIVSDTQLQVCPPLCLQAGSYLISYGNANGTLGSLSVNLVAPTTPTLVCEASHKAGTQQCLFLHNGGTGQNLQFTIISPFNTPSVMPGIISLAIGANFTNYMCGPGLQGECVKDDLGVIPLSMVGQTVYFQSILLDPNGVVFPLLTSNVCDTTYF